MAEWSTAFDFKYDDNNGNQNLIIVNCSAYFLIYKYMYTIKKQLKQNLYTITLNATTTNINK